MPVPPPVPLTPVEAAAALAGELLAPNAETVDQGGVPRSHLDALGGAGLLGLTAGCGADVPAADVRRVTEVLAGACGATWFVSTQHATPLALVAESDNAVLRERWLRSMCSGQMLAAIGFTHLRRRDRMVVRADRAPGGWVFTGDVAWVSSWGLADLVLLAGESPAGEVVWALLPATARPGLRPSPPMHLAAMQASSTVSLRLSGLAVRDEDVVAVQPLAAWADADLARTANTSPAVFGLLASILARLNEMADLRNDLTTGALADRLAAERARLRVDAYRLMDQVPLGERLDERLAVRAAALELAMRSATALVVATGGSAMSLQAAPQRLLREAMFYLVQAQTAAVREATLRRLGQRS